MEVIRLANIYGEDKGTGYAGNVWEKHGLCPTLTTMSGGNRQPMILDGDYIYIRQATKQGVIALENGGGGGPLLSLTLSYAGAEYKRAGELHLLSPLLLVVFVR